MGTLSDISKPYTALESWFYDRFIAPTVSGFASELKRRLMVDLPPGATVLDVGCGGGHNAMLLADEYPGVHVTGLDLSAEQIARARRRTSGRDSEFSWIVGSALDMPFPDDSFSAVMSVGSIKHWPDPARGVAECVRVLEPGGRLVIVEADRGCRYEDALRFVEPWPTPKALKLVALGFFRTWVAGRSLSVDEARSLFDGLPVRDATVEPLPGLPAFIMTAEAAAPPRSTPG